MESLSPRREEVAISESFSLTNVRRLREFNRRILKAFDEAAVGLH